MAVEPSTAGAVAKARQQLASEEDGDGLLLIALRSGHQHLLPCVREVKQVKRSPASEG